MRFAHLTDTHIDGTADRSERLARALDDGAARGARHLLLTGDLTANGTQAQIGELAKVLHGWPHGATLIDGNHDEGAIARSLGGPLARFWGTSMAGQPFDIGDVTVMPLSTHYPKRAFMFRALGSVGAAQLSQLSTLALETDRPIVVAMHHGPQLDPIKAFAGLVDRHHIESLLRANPHVHVACGHDHRVMDVGQVHVAAACASHPDPLRIYDVGVGRFASVYRSPCEGSYFGDAVCPIRSA